MIVRCPDCGSRLSADGCAFCALCSWCDAQQIARPEAEYRFDPRRRWRLDAAWVALHVAVEIEGGVWSRGRHTRGEGFVRDMEKYNMATLRRWRILRYTPQQVIARDGLTVLLAVLHEAAYADGEIAALLAAARPEAGTG